MKTQFYKISIFILIVLMVSCSNNEDETELNDFKGLYKIKSIKSNLPIDLNNDGIKSFDYLKEIKSKYIAYDGRIIDYMYNNELQHNFAEARGTAVQQSNRTQFLDIAFPIQRIDSLFQGKNSFVKLNMEYSTIVTGFIYKLIDNNIEIESDPFDDFKFYDIKNFEITRINKLEFEVAFDFKVYDFKENDWIETRLITNYDKLEE